MTEGFRFLVRRRGPDPSVPVGAGDEVVTYELAEPWPYADLPAHTGCWRVDFMLRKYVTDWRESEWQVEHVLRCSCRARRAIAQLQVHVPTGHRWVAMVDSQATRSTVGLLESSMWPLHGQPNQSPHIGGIARCKGCRTRWLVVSTLNGAALIRLKSATPGKVAE